MQNLVRLVEEVWGLGGRELSKTEDQDCKNELRWRYINNKKERIRGKKRGGNGSVCRDEGCQEGKQNSLEPRG